MYPIRVCGSGVGSHNKRNASSRLIVDIKPAQSQIFYWDVDALFKD
jgi:hypothetical protein